MAKLKQLAVALAVVVTLVQALVRLHKSPTNLDLRHQSLDRVMAGSEGVEYRHATIHATASSTTESVLVEKANVAA